MWTLLSDTRACNATHHILKSEHHMDRSCLALLSRRAHSVGSWLCVWDRGGAVKDTAGEFAGACTQWEDEDGTGQVREHGAARLMKICSVHAGRQAAMCHSALIQQPWVSLSLSLSLSHAQSFLFVSIRVSAYQSLCLFPLPSHAPLSHGVSPPLAVSP